MPDSRETRIPWRLIIAIWLLPAVADVADTYVSHRVHGNPYELWRVILLVAPAWLSWIFFTPLIFWLASRFRVQRPFLAGTIAVHVVAAIVVGMLHAAVYTCAEQLFENHMRMSNVMEFGMAIESWLPLSSFLYCGALGAFYALEAVQRERAQALRTKELEGQLARSELAVLRAQLHPHFLFNALNTAVSLVRANEPEAGVRVLTHLSDLLRHLVHGVEQEVTLRDELRTLDSYLEIERARFGSRLTIGVDVPDALLDAYVPGLVLQPLVENAVRHGVGRRDAPGHVWIGARTLGTALELSVRDDGPGLAPSSRSKNEPGVGIANTRARLLRLYGDEGSLALRNAPGGGAEAIVLLPLRHTRVHDAAELLVTTQA